MRNITAPAKNKKVQLIDLGLIAFKDAWEYQESLFTKLVEKKTKNRDLPIVEQEPTNNYLIFCEHLNVFTIGKSGNKDHLLINEQQLATKEATFYEINRGGDITYHGPGQLVIYPILDLDNFFTDIHKYLRFLEEAVITSIKKFGVGGYRVEGLTGVWVGKETDPRKICAMGVRSSRWVTMHGLALNVNTDLSYFKDIVPCGINNKAVTSLKAETGLEINLSEVKKELLNELGLLFEMEII